MITSELAVGAVINPQCVRERLKETGVWTVPIVSAVAASPGKSRQQAWREKLQEFASKSSEELCDEWELLLKELGLTRGYYLAVCEVLKQRRWETARYPRAYVKYAATIEARKMHLSIPHDDDTLEFHDPHLEFAGGIGDFDRNTARVQFEAYARYEAEMEARMYEEQKPRLPADWWIRQEPDAVYLNAVEKFNRSHNEQHIHPRTKRTLDWKRLAGEAGFGAWELKVLEYRKDGTSRDVALGQQPNERSRKALQAAWRQFDRTGMKRLQVCVKKNLSDCPE